MVNLVPVPWQPAYYLTPDTLAYLVAASNRVGVQLRLTDGWRSYAEQAALYQAYREGRGAIASNPDTGQRNHMRGAAFDLVRTDQAVQAACRAVGLIRDPDESWHWNNPNWRNMPIIPTLTDVSGGGNVTPIGEDDEMTPDEKKQLADTSAMVKAMWEWMGGGTPTTQFYDIKKQLGSVQATTDNLAAGKGEVHKKLDDIKYSVSDPKVGLREAVGALTAYVKSKLGG